MQQIEKRFDGEFGSEVLIKKPFLTTEERESVQKILEALAAKGNITEQAQLLLQKLAESENPLNLKQKVYLLLEVSEELFKAFQKIYPYIQLPHYLVAADIRRRMNLGSGYPEEWDSELVELPGFSEEDGLKRIENGEFISFERAIELRQAQLAYNFIRLIHDQAAAHSEAVPANPQNVYARFIEFAKQFTDTPGDRITFEDTLDGVESFSARYQGNEQIATMCQYIAELIKVILSYKDAQGNVDPSSLPAEPQFNYPPYQPVRKDLFRRGSQRQRI